MYSHQDKRDHILKQLFNPTNTWKLCLKLSQFVINGAYSVMKTICSTWQLMKMGLEIGVWWEKPEGVLISHLGGLRFKGCGSGMCLCHKLLFHVYVAAHEPVWVWTPNLLTIAVSPETPLYTFLPFSPFHLVLCVCTYVCLCLHFFQATYQISMFSESHSSPLPPPLFV